jgi:hypothetical protein
VLPVEPVAITTTLPLFALGYDSPFNANRLLYGSDVVFSGPSKYPGLNARE